MELFNQLASPQSMEHFHLLVFVLGVVSVVYIPYLAYLTGMSVLSYAFGRIGRRRSNPAFRDFSVLLIDAALIDVKMIAYLGIIPSFTLLFLISQLLQSTPALSVSLLAAACLFLAGAAVLLYAYRFSSRMDALLTSVEGKIAGKASSEELSRAVSGERQHHEQRARSLGVAGTVLLTGSALLTAGAIAVASDPVSWNEVESIFGLLLMPAVWLKFLGFFLLVPPVTGISLLFLLAYGKAGFDRMTMDVQALARSTAVRLAVAGLLLQPLMIVAGFAVVRSQTVSSLTFALAGGTLVCFFAALHFVYALHKEKKQAFAAAGFAAMVAGLAFLMIQDQVTIGVATRPHAAVMALAYEKATEDFKASLGISLVTVTGEDIYNGRCSACHLPDTRKVGPPFTLAIEKYRNRRDALSAFIRNPQKVDPAYPPMPNQGLKPAEVDSVASFLIRKYLETASPSS